MEGAAPVAPAAPAPNGASSTNGQNGQQSPAQPVKAKPSEVPAANPKAPPAEAKQSPGRGPDGKFLPGQGAEKDAKETPEEKAFRFKRKLKDGDTEYEVDLDEDAVAREISIARAAKKRLGELNRRLKELDEREAKAAALEKEWANPEERAARLLAEKAQRSLMSPEEQRIADLEAKLQDSDSRWQKYEEEQKSAAQQAYEDKMWAQEEPAYLKAMDKAKLPRDMSVLAFMARVGEQFTTAFGQEHRPDPELVVAETNAQLGKFAEHYVFSLTTEALAEKLGPERLKALMQHRLEKWKAAQSQVDPLPRTEEEPAPVKQEADARKEYLSEADVRRRTEERFGY